MTFVEMLFLVSYGSNDWIWNEAYEGWYRMGFYFDLDRVV
jgi:hypothetical protein